MRKNILFEYLRGGSTLEVPRNPWGMELPYAILKNLDPIGLPIKIPMWQIDRWIKTGELVRTGSSIELGAIGQAA